jgi:histidinol dehydrogenase
MALSINPVENHREREKGILVYPVYSRRSGGLSIGINLFPDKKQCPFDCPYCEVFPFSGDFGFSLDQMEKDLCIVIDEANKKNVPVKDICFSGNGEPSLSPFFDEALKSAYKIRKAKAQSANIVLITNGAGLLNKQIFNFLQEAVPLFDLDIWLKLDAGTPQWYEKINRSSVPFTELITKIKEFVSLAPVTIQTMLCAVGGESPSGEEEQEWEHIALELAANGNIRKVQIYGKARPAPEDPKTQPLPAEYLERRAVSLQNVFTKNSIHVPVEIYL